jgi:hypothetical protein
MLDPLGVAKQPPDRRSIKTATTSAGKKVSFWLEEHTTSKGILLLGASCPDTPDPYGGDAIPSFLEVVGVDKGLALLRLRTPDRGVPTDYFVCDIADDDEEVAQRLPQGIYCSGGSVGLLRIVDGSSNNSRDKYLVANLRIELDENTEKMEAHLDRWSPYLWYKWNQQKVDLPFPPGSVDLFITVKISDIHDNTGLADADSGNVQSVARATLIDRLHNQLMTVIDFPTGFGVPVTAGKINKKTSATVILNHLSQPALPPCTTIELISTLIKDPNGNTFANLGTYLP